MWSSAAVERVVAVDWSGDRSVAGQRRKIWAGVWSKDAAGRARVELASRRTRDELVDWLIAMARETPAMVVGVDFCFSYPAWFVREHGAASAPEFWEVVLQRGERWLSRECEDVRFWGRPRKKPPEFCGEDGATRMLRLADCECKVASFIEDGRQAEKVKGIAPKSPFQIAAGDSLPAAAEEGGICDLAVRCGTAADASGDLSAAADGAGKEERARGAGALSARPGAARGVDEGCAGAGRG